MRDHSEKLASYRFAEKNVDTERSLVESSKRIKPPRTLGIEQHGSSTARYLEKRAMKIFDSGETSSPDSKDLDQ